MKLAFLLFALPAFAAPHALQLNTEYPQPGEAAQFQAFAEQVTRFQDKNAEGGAPKRGFHGKHHGCVKGEFQVLPSLPLWLMEGIFSEPKTYVTWARFSNGVGKVQPDTERDVRGLALKLVGVYGSKILDEEIHTQDFLMTNKPTAMKDAKTFMEFADAAVNGSLAWFFLRHPGEALPLLKAVTKKSPSLLTETYWSGVPISLGSRAVKFLVKPCTVLNKVYPKRPGANYLREDLAAHLSREEACFNFYIQPQTDPYKTPIEDSSVEWTEKLSPPVAVAKLVLPVQRFSSAEQDAFCEKLSYTPWHALREHRPLGNVMRARKVIYQASQKHRLSHHVEPDGREQFE